MDTIIQTYLNPDWINGDFKTILITFNSLNKNNNFDVPIISAYISQIFLSLRNLSYQFQQQFQILTYNPFFTDDSVYFCNTPLFCNVNNDQITFTNFIELSKVLVKLQAITDYMQNNNFVNNDVTDIISLTQRLYSIVSFFTRYLTVDNSTVFQQDINKYGTVVFDYGTTTAQIKWNTTIITAGVGVTA